MPLAEVEYALDSSIPTQRILHIRIGASDVRLALNRAAAHIKPDVSAPGFRRGQAPLALIRKHHAGRVEAAALTDLRREAQEQVFKLLSQQDQPFTPPELQDQDQLRLRYGQPFEYAVKYLIDPAGLSHQPEQPQQPGGVSPSTQVQHPVVQGLGIPAGPKLPTVP